MNSQLDQLAADLRVNAERARDLAARAGEVRMVARPQRNSWSAAECLEHLTLSTEMMLATLRRALVEARAEPLRAAGSFEMDFIGSIFARMLEPPYRLRAKAPKFLRPSNSGGELQGFLATQDRFLELVAQSDGLPLDRIKVASPVLAQLRYSFWSSLQIAAAHQRRHLWQAERAAGLSE